MDPLLPVREECMYTSCYCEENVWKLCEYVKQNHSDQLKNSFAVFISNDQKSIPLWKQRASQNPGLPVIWDYHVLFLHRSQQKTMVYDMDSELSYPCTFQTYVDEALRSEENIRADFRRQFRVIPAETFLDTFASSREHMFDKTHNVYLAEPPSYPPICTENSENNIEDFISMEKDTGYGEVMNLNKLLERFC